MLAVAGLAGDDVTVGRVDVVPAALTFGVAAGITATGSGRLTLTWLEAV